MREVQCNVGGSKHYEEGRVEYLFFYQGEYLLVPNTSVEACVDCGIVDYDAAVMK